MSHHFSHHRFQELSLEQLYEILAFRQAVFIVEQDCPYMDADGLDQQCIHVRGVDQDQQLIAYTRIVPKGLSYPNHVAIGRVISSKKVRGQGLGKKIMEKSIDLCLELYPDDPIKLSAQSHLQKFYGDLRFEAIGDEYLEDGIPHIAMIYKPMSKA